MRLISFRRLLIAGSVAAGLLVAGPLEFGVSEVNRAMAARGLKPGLVRFRTEITSDGPESFRIQPGRITGGDLRGLMYGLLEAAEQIRLNGRLAPAKGSPAVPMRGIRCFLHNQDLEKDWYYSRDYWSEFIRMLARNRFNRFNLVFAHQTNYLAPPYPFWVSLAEFPGVRAPGLGEEQRKRNLEMLRFISQTAAEHAIDFTLGVWEHNIQANMQPTTEGLTRENIGPYSYAALKAVLAACPAIRGVQMRTNSESGIPNDQQVEFYRDWVWRAIRETGRRVTLDLRGWTLRPGMLEAVTQAGVPLRMSSKYWAEDLGRPYTPAETWPGYSFNNFFEKPRPYDFFWELWGLGSHRLLVWGDPEYVRRAAGTFTTSGSMGFEIDPPLAQKGFGNRPGTWGVFTPAQKERVFWRYEFERYWLFYLLWGRLTYDPRTPERVWAAEFKRRFGAAAADVQAAYSASSRVLHEIVAVHLANPNMYIWPEINPGGLIEAYKDVRPSDWRLVASIGEAVRNRARGTPSAKQTPLATATRLHEMALAAEQAVERARSKVAPGNREWLSSEPDFQVLAGLARYHGRKQMAADQLTWFYETGDLEGLLAARRELESALRVWEKLVKLTDGVYPAEMAFGPADVGHWKDKLPYVAHDLKLVDERLKIFDQFGRFDFGFDFGGPVAQARGSSYRSDPYVLRNTVEPRFQPVDSRTEFSEERGYGWATPGERADAALPLTPYEEVRAVASSPRQLPHDALFGDSIAGRGAQTFRLRAAPGEYEVFFLKPDRTAELKNIEARDGVLDVVFPEGEWRVCGLVVKSKQPQQPPPRQRWPGALSRPTLTHTPPKSVLAERPVTVTLRIWPLTGARAVRLHYRPLNQQAEFKTLEAPASRPVFTIPAEDVSPRWDLMYYFEVLNREGGGWFEPDPDRATPYFVVKVERPPR